MKTGSKYVLWAVWVLLGIWGCRDDDTLSGSKVRLTTYKVAVVQPLEMHGHLQEVAAWAQEQTARSQAYLKEGVRLELEWYDENAPDLKATLQRLAGDRQVCALIGPYHSSNVAMAAEYCKNSGKALILPTVSSTELQRAYAGKGFMWFLTESDITQCEMLLMKAIEYKARKVSLLAKEDEYGNSFIDWFAFQAGELGLTVGDLYLYTEDNLPERIAEIGNSDTDVLICAPSDGGDVVSIQRLISRFAEEGQTFFPTTLYSDVACSPVLPGQLDADAPVNLEGVTMCADPSSGFSTAYQLKFGKEPLNGEAHFFDAVSLLTYGLFAMQSRGRTDLNSALTSVVDGRDSDPGLWGQPDMETTFRLLSDGRYPDISGATGSLDFDAKMHTSVIRSVYAFWTYYNGNYILIQYLSSDGSRRTESSLAGWNWRTSELQEFDPDVKDRVYPPLNDRWALLISASEGWTNYRHQADVLAMYDLLRRYGYHDDHIVLIMQDDIAWNPKNPYPGVVCVTPEQLARQKNLRENATIDYRLSDLKPSDLSDILCGKSSPALPAVIGSSANDNVLVFWSGHGENGGSLNWGRYQSYGSFEMYQMLHELENRHSFRKMLFVIEACYSGALAEYCSGIPGMLFITAANAHETSKADLFNDQLGVFMSNGFTRGFQDAIDLRPDITMRDLYYRLARYTVGSHVCVYNEKEFGNLYRSSMRDFLN